MIKSDIFKWLYITPGSYFRCLMNSFMRIKKNPDMVPNRCARDTIVTPALKGVL